MKSKKGKAMIMLLTGLLLLFFAWFLYVVYEPASNTDSPRLQDLNALINTIGQLPAAVLIGGIGLFVCVFAVRKWKR